jgi:hypothetical protein
LFREDSTPEFARKRDLLIAHLEAALALADELKRETKYSPILALLAQAFLKPSQGAHAVYLQYGSRASNGVWGREMLLIYQKIYSSHIIVGRPDTWKLENCGNIIAHG